MEGFLEKIPESLKKFVDPSMPKEMRLMAAKGLIPVPPKDMALVLYCLTLDLDTEISKEAERSLKSMPEQVIATVVGDISTPPELLDYIGRNTTNDSILEKIILNQSTSDTTITYLAETVHAGSLTELIANNQVRILRSAEIVEALSKNPSISRSTLDRVVSFLRLYLEKKGEIPKFLEEDKTALDTSQEVEGLSLDTEGTEKESESTVLEDVRESFLDSIDFSKELIEETEEEIGERKRENLLYIIKQMRIPERIKLAILGNTEVRKILVRDPNKLVASAVLKNPRLTDMEVVLIAQSKTVDEELLREISATRKWARVYRVKVALVNNPKTPAHIALNFIRHLRDKELKSLMQNKDVPGVIVSAAKRLVQERREKGN
jgi:hypothetical protein